MTMPSARFSQVVDFSTSIINDLSTLVMPATRAIAVNFTAYIDIFSYDAWAFCALMVVLLALAFLVIHRSLGPRALGAFDGFGPLEALGVVSATLIQRECKVDTNAGSARALFNVTCLFAFVFFSFYTAVLTSLMTARSPAPPVRSLADVLDTDLQVFVWCSTADLDFLRNGEPGSPRRLVYESLGALPCANTVAESLNTLMTTPYSILYGTSIGLMGNPDVRVIPDVKESQIHGMHFAVPEDSELLPLIERSVISMRQNGLLSLVTEQWYGRGARAGDEAATAEVSSLGLDNVFFPCLALAAGVFSALTLVFFERVGRCREEARWRKRSPRSELNRAFRYQSKVVQLT